MATARARAEHSDSVRPARPCRVSLASAPVLPSLSRLSLSSLASACGVQRCVVGWHRALCSRPERRAGSGCMALRALAWGGVMRMFARCVVGAGRRCGADADASLVPCMCAP